jgi:hypothetical protein
MGIISVGFEVTDQLFISFLHSSDTGEKLEYKETTSAKNADDLLGGKHCGTVQVFGNDSNKSKLDSGGN